jgi:DNA repair protein RadA/Sms
MATKSAYVCTECGAEAAKWSGACSACGAWNTLTEFRVAKSKSKQRIANYSGEINAVTMLSEVSADQPEERYTSGIAELDRVLGGGLVAGSALLLGGDPGIGKSTLLLQVSSRLARERNVLYVSGEESASQIYLRAKRLNVPGDNIATLTETSVNNIIRAIETEKPEFMVIDSVQTVYVEELDSAPGSVSQVRESAAALTRIAKRMGVVMVLVGHVTKEGAIAGPRVLEHMVDTVLYFEGDANSRFRVVRAIKNRFGAVNELGVFAMTETGLREVANPSAIFLSRPEGEPPPGSVILVTREGTRPLLVELQGLADKSYLANPRRVCLGFEHNRMAMLLAVLHRHGGISTYDQDVFVNVAGGMKITETGADLAVILTLVSSLRNSSLGEQLVVFGEVGLAGEVRPVPGGEERLKEAHKHGFTTALIPKGNKPKKSLKGMEVVAVRSVSEALAFACR